MKAKFITEWLFLVALTIIFLYYLMKATNAATTVDNTFNSYGQQRDPRSQQLVFETFESQSYEYYKSMQSTIYLSYIALTFPFRIVLTWAFAMKSQRTFYIFTFSN
jgi:hypothetical protein